MLRRIEKRKEKRKKLIMGIVLVVVMIMSLLGVIVGAPTDPEWEYNDYKFEQVQDSSGQIFFLTKINGEDKGFNFLPLSLETIPVANSFSEKTQSPLLYLTFDPGANRQNLMYVDLVRNDIERNFKSTVISGTINQTNSYTLPVITCENATSYSPVFYFNVSTNTSIVKKDNCFIVNAELTEFFKARDLFLYHYFGVMNDS